MLRRIFSGKKTKGVSAPPPEPELADLAIVEFYSYVCQDQVRHYVQEGQRVTLGLVGVDVHGIVINKKICPIFDARENYILIDTEDYINFVPRRKEIKKIKYGQKATKTLQAIVYHHQTAFPPPQYPSSSRSSPNSNAASYVSSGYVSPVEK